MAKLISETEDFAYARKLGAEELENSLNKKGGGFTNNLPDMYPGKKKDEVPQFVPPLHHLLPLSLKIRHGSYLIRYSVKVQDFHKEATKVIKVIKATMVLCLTIRFLEDSNNP